MNGKTVAIVLAFVLIAGVGGWYVGRQQGLQADRDVTAESSPAAGIESLPESAVEPEPRSVGTVGSTPPPSTTRRPLQSTRNVTSRENQTPPPGPAIDVIRRLRPLAEQGDARAALQIFQKLEQCEGVLKSNLRDGSLADGDEDAAGQARILKDIEGVLKDCQGLSDQDFSQMGQWLDRAAAGGDLLAMLRYGNAGYRYIVGSPTQMLRHPEKIVEYRQKAMSYLHTAAAQGEPTAMDSLANSYSNGIITNKDLVRAYAYAVAADLVLPAGPRGPSNPYIQSLAKGLSTEEISKGDRMAKQIYDECCINQGAK